MEAKLIKIEIKVVGLGVGGGRRHLTKSNVEVKTLTESKIYTIK